MKGIFSRYLPIEQFFALLPIYTFEGKWCWLKTIWRDGLQRGDAVEWTYYENKPIRIKSRY